MYDKNGAVIDRREMLRVKIKSLAEEAKIIRHEERRCAGRKHESARRVYAEKMKEARKIENNLDRHAAIAAVRLDHRLAKAKLRPRRNPDELYEQLRAHRIFDVRREARHSHIAYGLIRGRSLERIETAPKTQPNWSEIERLVKKYGPRDFIVKKPES